MQRKTIILIVAALTATSRAAKGDFITTKFGSGTPVGSWAYSKAEGVGHGNDTTYMPVLNDWSPAVFQGYVYRLPEVWNTVGSGIHDEDTIYVFRTFAMSTSDITIPMRLGGDDGHSIYINDVFVGGGGFAANIDFDLFLAAGVPTKIELGNYNGPGAMIADLHRRDNGLRLEDTAGVSVNAELNASVVPEPTSLTLLVIGSCGLVLERVRRVREK
jgi:hypothetical protein